jgi:hypothetical protein
VFLTHGDDEPRKILQQKLNERWGLEVSLPTYANEAVL